MNRGAPYDENLRVDRVNSGKSKVRYCEVCSNTLQGKQKSFCSVECQGIASRKTERPTKEKLKKLMETNSMVSIGKMFGVSDNAVRKWAKIHDLL